MAVFNNECILNFENKIKITKKKKDKDIILINIPIKFPQ